jgi:KDO2-lipid IV(A) lauroyltransferase
MHKLEYYIVKTLFYIFSRISIKSGRRLAMVLYFIIAKIIRYRKKVILDNLHRVYGDSLPDDKKRLLNNIYKNFVFLWMEFLQLTHLNKNNLADHFNFNDLDKLDRALSKGKGVIFMTGHYGNFEWLGQALILKNYHVWGIAKKQSNPYVNEFIEKIRRELGAEVIYTKNAMKEGLEVLKKNHLLAIVADQDAGKKGVFVDFLGQPSSTAIGPAVFHLRSGAPILCAVAVRKDYGKFDIYFEEVTHNIKYKINDKKIKEITQLHASVLGKWVLKYPEQWFWMHRRWKTKP